MASAKNKVIAGDYINWVVQGGGFGGVSIYEFSWSMKGVDLNKSTVASYELMTEEKMKSGSSAILRGALGAAVLGPVGILAGLTAKNKGIYLVAVEWKDGKKSLIEIDDKLYKYFLKGMF